MGLNKSAGNMYRWVSHTWNPIAGACPHQCEYCYVEDLKSKPVLAEKYSGEPRLVPEELFTKLGSGNVIFVQNCGDLFADGVPHEAIMGVLALLREYDGNRYLLQTKNPPRMIKYAGEFPPDVIIGTTVESDNTPESNAPDWISRLTGLQATRLAYKMHTMKDNPNVKMETMVSVEPITAIQDMQTFLACLASIKPNFISIGADSKDMGLNEPEPFEVFIVAYELAMAGFKIILKPNLKRITGEKLWKELLSDKNISEL